LSDQPFLSEAMSEFIDALDEMAQREGVSEIVFMFVREHEAGILETLTGRGYTNLSECCGDP